MASRIFKTGVSILLAAHTSNAQLASTTPNGNLSVSTTASPGPTATGGSCCVVVPIDVGLNFWWNSTITRTLATVITQVYQYNNTAITSTTTISANGSFNDVPQSIIPGSFIYSNTLVGTETVISLPNTVVASPTPFVAVAQVGMVYGTWSESSNSPVCDETSMDPPRGLPTVYGYVEDPPISRTTHQAYANPPGTELIDFWIQHEPTITNEIPGLKTCEIPSGSGEPSVHVPVTGLTSHETKTIKMDGGGPAPPVSTKTRVPAEPITTKPPTTTKAPEPGPTSKPASNPPPVQGTETLPPPENTKPSEPEQPPPASTGGSNPNPNPNPNNPQQPPPASTGGSNPNPNPNPNPNNPQQPAPTTAGQPNIPNPNNPQQPAPTTAGQPGSPNPNNPNPNNPNPSQGPGSPLPIDLTPVPAPAPAPTTAGAPPMPTQPVTPPAVILPNGETLQPGTVTTISSHTVSIPTDAPSVTVIDGTTVQAPPIVVVDGTTATFAPTGVAEPVPMSITVGEGASASVVAITAAPSASGGGIVLPNGETLLPGSTATYLGETLVLTTASEGGSTIVQVIDSSTTEVVTVPTAASSSVFVYGSGNGTSTTGSISGSGSGTTPSQTSSSAPEEATGAGDELLPQGAAVVFAAMGAAVVLGL